MAATQSKSCCAAFGTPCRVAARSLPRFLSSGPMKLRPSAFSLRPAAAPSAADPAARCGRALGTGAGRAARALPERARAPPDGVAACAGAVSVASKPPAASAWLRPRAPRGWSGRGDHAMAPEVSRPLARWAPPLSACARWRMPRLLRALHRATLRFFCTTLF